MAPGARSTVVFGPSIAKALGIREDQVAGYHIDRRSLDARHKPDLRFIYRLTAQVDARAGVREEKGVSVLTEPSTKTTISFHLSSSATYPNRPSSLAPVLPALWRLTC